jgi:hypothetical protein
MHGGLSFYSSKGGRGLGALFSGKFNGFFPPTWLKGKSEAAPAFAPTTRSKSSSHMPLVERRAMCELFSTPARAMGVIISR